MATVRSFKEDYITGTQSEDKHLNIIGGAFNNTFIKQKKNSIFDFASDCNTVYVELKTRSNNYNAYPTTLIPANKVKVAEANPSKTYYFCFAFTDGLYYIEYSKEVFDTFECKPFRRRQRIDFNDKVAEYYYIPIDKLTEINYKSMLEKGYGEALCTA